MLVVERHKLEPTPEIIKLCTLSKELYNKCNFLMRKAWFGDERLPDLNILVHETQGEDCFQNLHNTKTAKQTIRKCLTDWSNFSVFRGKGIVLEVRDVVIDYDTRSGHEGLGKTVYRNCLVKCVGGIGWTGEGSLVLADL